MIKTVTCCLLLLMGSACSPNRPLTPVREFSRLSLDLVPTSKGETLKVVPTSKGETLKVVPTSKGGTLKVVPSTKGGTLKESFRQIERLGHPAINQGLVIGNDLLNAWNQIPPAADLGNDAAASKAEADFVLKSFGNSGTRSAQLLQVLLPDVLRIDTTRKSGYVGSAAGKLDNLTPNLRPIGGRMITDDVMDMTLRLVMQVEGQDLAGLQSDHVSYAGPNAYGTGHQPVLSGFPYLPDPH